MKTSHGTQSVLTDLAGHPEDTHINWSKFAWEHGVPGRNGGQVVKEYAKRNGFDTTRLDNKSNNTPRRRPSKNKLPGKEMSSPCMPPVSKVKQELDVMIETGVIRLGEPVASYTLQRFKISDTGELVMEHRASTTRTVHALAHRL